MAIAVIADKGGAAARRHDELPVLEILIPEIGRMLLGESDLVDQLVSAHDVGDVFDAFGKDNVTYHRVTIEAF